MTKEKLQFLLPVVFTVGPDVNQRGAKTNQAAPARQAHGAQSDHELEEAADPNINPEDHGDALMKYAMLLADADPKKHGTGNHIENIVKGIIEGETRVLVSSMTMEESTYSEPVSPFKRLLTRIYSLH
jgi:flotillin